MRKKFESDITVIEAQLVLLQDVRYISLLKVFEILLEKIEELNFNRAILSIWQIKEFLNVYLCNWLKKNTQYKTKVFQIIDPKNMNESIRIVLTKNAPSIENLVLFANFSMTEELIDLIDYKIEEMVVNNEY